MAALFAVVMILSCMSIAYAEMTNAYTMDTYDTYRRKVTIEADIKEGDVISFWVKPVYGDNVCTDPNCGVDNCEAGRASVYVRNYKKIDGERYPALYIDADGNVTNVECYSKKALEDNAISKTDDGWYFVKCEAQADNDEYEICVNCYGSDMSEDTLIADVRVNDQPVGLIGGEPVNGEGSNATPAPTAAPTATPAPTAVPEATAAPEVTATPDAPVADDEAPVDNNLVWYIIGGIIPVAAIVVAVIILKKK